MDLRSSWADRSTRERWPGDNDRREGLVTTIATPRRTTGPPSADSARYRDLEITDVVDGDVMGHRVTVLEGAVVNGAVDARSVIVRGRVRGIVRAVSVEIMPTGRIEGELRYEILFVHDGARVDARCIPSRAMPMPARAAV